jgi:hypothetical protein
VRTEANGRNVVDRTAGLLSLDCRTELTRASLEHDAFCFGVLRKKVSKFYISERNSHRHFGFPRGTGVELLLRGGRRFICRTEVIEFLIFRREEVIDLHFSTHFAQKKPLIFHFPADFNFSAISQFELQTTIFTSFYPFPSLHQAAYTEQCLLFAVAQ